MKIMVEHEVYINIAPLTDEEQAYLAKENNSITARLQRIMKRWGK